MNIYQITRTDRWGYDDYDSAIVAAKDEEEARNTHPNGARPTDWNEHYSSWANSPSDVRVTLIGLAAPNIEAGVILASFNAG